MLVPTLPQNDRNRDARDAALAVSRAQIDFDRTRGGMVFPSDVPAADNFTHRWAFEAMSLAVATEVLELPGAFEVAVDDTRTPEERVIALKDAVKHALEHRHLNRPAGPFRPLPHTARTPLTLAEHALLLGELPQTEGVARWDDDFYFAWQRIASDCNGVIALVTRASWPSLHARMPLDSATFSRVRPGDELERALDEHRVMVCDLAILDGIDAGMHLGWRRWLPPAIAIFALTPDRSTLLPVAIQCGQRNSSATPIVTPLDGAAWKMARAAYSASESTLHGVSEHGARCHMALGAVAVAMHRTLAPSHPIRVLLNPHFEMTIGIAKATGDLYVPGGRTPTLQSISVDGVIELTDRTLRDFDWHARSLERHFGDRGLGSTDVFPEMPVRDDLALYTTAIRAFVDRYIALYYATDADVVGDVELQEWVRVVKSPTGAGIPSFVGADRTVTTLAGLCDLVAGVIWRASPWHAVVNYPVYETTAFAPAYPASLYGPPPRGGRAYDEDDFVALLPPESVVRGLLVDLVQVSSIRLNRIGHYPHGTFTDNRVHGLVDRFKLDLDGIGRRIHERNRVRAIPYPFLDPKLVTASTHI